MQKETLTEKHITSKEIMLLVYEERKHLLTAQTFLKIAIFSPSTSVMISTF